MGNIDDDQTDVMAFDDQLHGGSLKQLVEDAVLDREKHFVLWSRLRQQFTVKNVLAKGLLEFMDQRSAAKSFTSTTIRRFPR